MEMIQSFTIEQWLLSDLREINNENGCLPKNLVEQKVTMLNGCYILQVTKQTCDKKRLNNFQIFFKETLLLLYLFFLLI